MSVLNFKDFLTSGACLQTGHNSFKILLGPFLPVAMEEVQSSKSTTFLYKAGFWDFLHNPAEKPQNFVYSAATAVDMNREEIIRWLEQNELEKPEISWADIAEESFKSQYDWSQALFEKKELLKTVPIIAQHSRTKLTPQNKSWLLRELIKKNNYGWTYAYFEGDTGILGHTPELLMQWDVLENKAQTFALAGTVAQGEGAKAEIISDLKIRQEHDYVIEDIQSKLAGFSAAKEPTDVLELKHLLHLQTRFLMPMSKTKDFLNCVFCLHPTAAMGIYPYDQKALVEFSEFDIQKTRGLFAGPFGFLGQKKSQIVVMIRGLNFNSDGCSIYSGCGITLDSRYDMELSELENKRNSVKKMLGLIHD